MKRLEIVNFSKKLSDKARIGLTGAGLLATIGIASSIVSKNKKKSAEILAKSAKELREINKNKIKMIKNNSKSLNRLKAKIKAATKNVTKSNPELKSVESTRKALKDSNHVWNF